VSKERRQHLHQTIDRHQLDMVHTTERIGSPQTLVCTKTRRSYELQCQQYRTDIAAMNTLLAIFDESHAETAKMRSRLVTAIDRQSLVTSTV
jgi:hypothetical protein